METTTIVVPQTAEVEQQTPALVKWAKSFAITIPGEREKGAEFLRRVKALRGTVSDQFKEPVSLAYRAHKAMKALEKKLDGPLLDAENKVKRTIIEWDTKQEKIRREREEALRREAQEREDARKLAEAERLEAAGHKEAADAVLEAPSQAANIVLPDEQPKTPGVTTRKTPWKFRIIDEKMIPREYMEPSTSKIGGLVRSVGKEAEKMVATRMAVDGGSKLVSGIAVYRDETIAVSPY